MSINFTKKEREQLRRANEYIRKFKAKCKKKDIQVTAKTGHGRIIIASGYNNMSNAKKYIKKITTGEGKKQLDSMGYSNPKIKIIKN